ncbi:alpha/beta fold hydrolase [Ideonella sp. YS5]|uniref:alpha/beta fold hydrolase n=1 Tax=Ideonella sp. YS5 TaxID=3453714 RepID=UPI003F7275C5
MASNFQRIQSLSRGAKTGLALASTVAAFSAWVEHRSRRAVRDNAPEGHFIEVDGVRLHCVERGEGPAVVLIHGNNVWWRDFLASGLIDLLSRKHRVIAFDRPGFGHSQRPRDRLWTPSAQASLIAAALGKIGVTDAAVVGHSMGAMVALALALDHPEMVRSLVLLGGYYFPKLRVDALVAAPVALPVLGDVMRHTVTALTARALLGGSIKQMFAPNDVPVNYLPTIAREMLLRPVQLRANAEDAAFMMPAASQISQRLHELQMPVTVMAGEHDTVVDPQAHSSRLHAAVPGSRLIVVPGAGHMVHHVAQRQIAEAVVAEPAMAPSIAGAATDHRRTEFVK